MKHGTLPDALRAVPPDVLENYVGSQIAMFANGLAHRLSQHGFAIPTDVYKESAREVFQLLISEPGPRRSVARAQDLQLVFRHDCLALGCLVPSCRLCKHNPSRRCAVNFDKKYLVNDVLKAKCQAVIRVEIVDRVSNQPVESSDLHGEMVLQMAILDGNTYDAKFEAGMENEFESCLLLMNNKGSPTLVGTAVSNDQHGFIRLPLVSSRAVLPDLRVTDSSEAMLSGRKPPLRLMMRAVFKDSLQPVPHIRHAISEGFVVATRRTRTAGKVDIPSVDDHVSKLEHMGRETVKKLSDVMEAAHQAGIDDLHIQGVSGKTLCIETVGAFQQLSLAADQDPHLQKRLQQILKLNKEKWEEAREHALKAVVVDNRMRVWWASPASANTPRIGMVFSCTKGTVDLETPIALIQEGNKMLFAADWTQAQLDVVRHMQPMALSHWWQPNHTNWDLLEWDSEVYKSAGQLVKAHVAELEALQESEGASIGAALGAVHGLHSSLFAPSKADISQFGTASAAPARPGRSAASAEPATVAAGTGAVAAGAPGSAGGSMPGLNIGALRNDEILDTMPSAPFMATGLQEYGGTGARLMSGTSIEGLVDTGNPLLLSRNTSGLDTMQSIEQALPGEGEGGGGGSDGARGNGGARLGEGNGGGGGPAV